MMHSSQGDREPLPKGNTGRPGRPTAPHRLDQRGQGPGVPCVPTGAPAPGDACPLGPPPGVAGPAGHTVPGWPR